MQVTYRFHKEGESVFVAKANLGKKILAEIIEILGIEGITDIHITVDIHQLNSPFEVKRTDLPI